MPCRPLTSPVEPEVLIPWPFRVLNITVANASLLKVYFWEGFDIDGLNKKLENGDQFLEHDFVVPTRQVNSKFLKVILWLQCNEEMELDCRRIKNCDCVHRETRVGFNQFRQLYHCPHRHLANIVQEKIRTQGNQEVLALSVVFYFYLFGQHRLSFELRCRNRHIDRVMHFHFLLDIIGFDPQKTILGNSLVPSKLSEYRRFIQPIWINNITMMNFDFAYDSHTRGLKILNPKLIVPRQSVWPLMVEYRPNDYENEVEITQTFQKAKTQHKLRAKGFTEEPALEDTTPIEDLPCKDFTYVLYPNRLEFSAELGEERSLMVAIHNYNQQCVEFRWQNYVISGLFSVNYEPDVFRLKPHHSKLIVVHLRAFQSPLRFQRVPIILEVHRVFDRSVKIAKEVLEEIESIDDPKWAKDSYLQHVLLQLDIRVNFPPEKAVQLQWELPQQISNTNVNGTHILPPSTTPPAKRSTTIFEQLFWEHLSHSNHMRDNKDPNINELLSYREVQDMFLNPPKNTTTSDIDKNAILKYLSLFVAEALRDISKNWIFVPIEAYLRSI